MKAVASQSIGGWVKKQRVWGSISILEEAWKVCWYQDDAGTVLEPQNPKQLRGSCDEDLVQPLPECGWDGVQDHPVTPKGDNNQGKNSTTWVWASFFNMEIHLKRSEWATCWVDIFYFMLEVHKTEMYLPRGEEDLWLAAHTHIEKEIHNNKINSEVAVVIRQVFWTGVWIECCHLL